MIIKLLKFLWVIQEVSNKDGKLGRGFSKAIRFNPYNPLSYITLIIIIIVGLFMFGFVGFWKEINMQNPFKWD